MQFIGLPSSKPNNCQFLHISMGREDTIDPTMVSSSIALLQERFRQLQRVKEKREEKQLLELFSTQSSLQPKMNVSSHRPALYDPLTVGINSPGKQADFRAVKTPSSSNLWQNTERTSSMPRNSDVDTSLHL
ncbi:SPBc2 prophage-derived uncharacterized protein yotK [Quillaja saponaria]|uniref:SPBc2 prophage-derived uncharacterized protein yotK n=1 Tax=Quillaja saponaria TaxID=32244 RepID=A0AAD7LNJ1_QUISA|nr:SPBc2 prophage-derived uncharacterized protein yotK [Quillaja saponaria]